MGRTTSIVMLLIGVLLFLGSCAPLGYILYHETLSVPLEVHDLPLDGSADSKSFTAEAGKLARFSVEMEIVTPSVQEDPESFDEEYIPRFRFPVSYLVRDAEDNVILREKTTLAWKDGISVTKTNINTSSTGGTLSASVKLKKFKVPKDGNIFIEIEIDEDSTYMASFSRPKLYLHENMIDNTVYVSAALLMLLAGFILGLIGVVALVVSAAQAGAEENPQIENVSANRSVNQEAMIIQLSALAGYVIPFGSIILPVILWLLWREKDAYLDEMGREAVNFQLSMLVYYCISFVLCLVLIGFLLLFIAVIFHFVYIIIAAVQVSHGNNYRYPLTIRFFRHG